MEHQCAKGWEGRRNEAGAFGVLVKDVSIDQAEIHAFQSESLEVVRS